MEVEDTASEIYRMKDEDNQIYSVLADSQKSKILGGAIIYIEEYGMLQEVNATRLSQTLRGLDQVNDGKIDYIDIENFLEGIQKFGLLNPVEPAYLLDGKPPFRDYRLNEIDKDEVSKLIEAGQKARQQRQISSAESAPKIF